LLGGALGINKSSDKIKVAQSLLEFMIGEEAQSLLKRNGCTIPVQRTIAEDDELLNPAIHPMHYNMFVEMMPYANSLQGLNLSAEQVGILHSELHVLWANMETPESACRRINLLFSQT
jgi:multiple sugar transport system substrate-binding protein